LPTGHIADYRIVDFDVNCWLLFWRMVFSRPQKYTILT
jgi:hypothetical protein